MCMSNFHRNYLLAACPADRTVDVKKSQYKKLSVFLEKMKVKGIIDTTKTQGVEVLTSVKVKRSPFSSVYVFKRNDAFYIIFSKQKKNKI